MVPQPATGVVTAQLSAVARSNPDVVLVWAVNPANAVVAKNAQAIGLKTLLFQAPGAATPTYIELGAAAAEGTLVQGSKILVPASTPQDDPQYKVVKQVSDDFKAKYGKPVNQNSGSGWDAMLIMVTALEPGHG